MLETGKQRRPAPHVSRANSGMLKTALSACRSYGHPTGADSIGSAALKPFEGAKASVDTLARHWLVLQSAPGLRPTQSGCLYLVETVLTLPLSSSSRLQHRRLVRLPPPAA